MTASNGLGKKPILITGATGNIGGKLRAHFTEAGYPVTSLCRNPGNDPGVQTCDLSCHSEAWAERFAGIDTVLHAAADPSPWADWDSLQRLNLDLLLNVLIAAQQHGVRRVVFASSNFVVAGHRFGRDRLTVAMPPRPINGYGASKLAGERIGRAFAERYGLSFIAFRIGVCQRDHANRHGRWIPFGRWGQAMWLSDRDLCAGFERAVEADGVPFGVYNLVSNNPGMRWDIQPLRDDLGFMPRDGEPADVTPLLRLQAWSAWLRDVAVPALGERLARRTW